MHSSLIPPLKVDRIRNQITPSSTFMLAPLSCSPQSFSLAMAASNPHLFQPSIANENETRKLVASNFHPNRVVLQWHPAAGMDILTPNTNEIMVFSSYFQHRFSLPVCYFLCGLLDHYQIELVHLNPNSILQIVILFHLCEVFLRIPPNFPLFKNYFLLKYQPSAANWNVAGGGGLGL
jgi:hypothetical protein